MSSPFGLPLANLFLPLMTGIPLVILSERRIKDLSEFLDVLERESITRVVLVPPVFKQMIELPRAAKRLRKDSRGGSSRRGTDAGACEAACGGDAAGQAA